MKQIVITSLLIVICAASGWAQKLTDKVYFDEDWNVISTRRNPVIADIMSRMHFMERRGSGFRKILDAIKTAPNYTDNTLPTFHSTPFIFTIEFKNMNDGFKVDGTINDTINDTLNIRINDTINASEDILEGDDRINDRINNRINDRINDRIKLTNTEVYVYSEIQQNPEVTVPLLMKKTGLSEPTINRSIKTLKDNELLIRIGARKNGYWQVNEIQNLKK